LTNKGVYIIGHFGDGPPGNHLHWYGLRTTKINSKINQTNTKKPKIQ